MAEIERATSVGQTGGLPGHNADPKTRLPTPDEEALAPAGNPPTSTTDLDSGDTGTSAEGDAYDEPDDPEYPDEADFSENPSPS